MSSKLSFRARALDPSKPMPIYFAEELHDLSDYAAINRAVPQMPSGMEKEEESVSGFTNIFLGCFLLHFV
jgi:enhancer of polycomb-like protein